MPHFCSASPGLNRSACLSPVSSLFVVVLGLFLVAGCGSSEQTFDAGADVVVDTDAATSPCQPLGPGMPCREDIETLNSLCYLDGFAGGTAIDESLDPRAEFRCRCDFDGMCAYDRSGWLCIDGHPWDVFGRVDDWERDVGGACDFSLCTSETCFEGALVFHPDNVPQEGIVPPEGECYVRAFPPGDPRNEYLCSCDGRGDLCERGRPSAGQVTSVYQCTSTRIGTYWKQATGLSVERELYPPRIPQCDFDICWSCDYRNHPLGN